MNQSFDPIQYKIDSRKNWNVVAPEYHKEWAAKQIGPFKSTKELVKSINIKQDDFVLDVGCGTGVVSKEICTYLKSGKLVGIDLSRTALSIAKKSMQFANANFIEMDAENITIHARFDKVVCQYALMFFPDTKRVLNAIKSIMKKNAKLAIAVHGTAEGVPYFSSIMNPILQHIPHIRPKGTPTVHRFGNPKDLRKEIINADFSNVDIKKFTFTYNAGTFEEYWSDYMHSTANTIRTKIESKGADIVLAIKKAAKDNVTQFSKNGLIEFPWDVLIATANH